MSTAPIEPHEDDTFVFFECSQELRHEAVCKINEKARELVAKAHATAQSKADPESGEMPPLPRFYIAMGPVRDTISIKQRKFYHGPVLRQIADQVRVDGVAYVHEVWKEYYRKLFLPDKFKMQRLPGAKRKTPVRQRVSTEDLNVKSYSELIDKVIAHAATEFGVAFVFDLDEREAVRYRAPVRKQKAQAAEESS